MPKRHIFLLCILLCVLFMMGLLAHVSAQDANQPAFTLLQQWGRQRPTGIQYDPNYDQLVMVDTSGRLVLADAATFTTRHILYERGPYNAYTFSHDGRYLALAIDLRVEIWDTSTGEIDVSLEPEGVLGITGPLEFADDDQLLRFDSVVPEPAATRVSENDTSIVPWLWDLPAARREAQSTLPNRARAYPFFDFRYGYLLGPNDLVIAGLPQRLQVINAADNELPVINEISTPRNERDPISVWQSVRDDLLYIRPINRSEFVQLNTEDGSTFTFLPGQEAFGAERIGALESLQISDQAQIIGEPLSTTSIPALEMLLGQEYRQLWGYNPITVMLLDILVPITPSADGLAVMIYVFDEERGTGTVDLIRPPDISHFELHPDNERLVVRRSDGRQPIEIYNLNTGLLERTIYPALPDSQSGGLFALTDDGSAILSGFERFSTDTGDVLREDLSLLTDFDTYFFLEDGESLVTINDDQWWVWDIATGELIRQETLHLGGERIVNITQDGTRFLITYEDNGNTVMEIVDIGAEYRESVTITRRSNMPAIEFTYPSPGWERFLVLYTNGDVELYDIDDGRLHHIAYDDLPSGINNAGWIDDETAYISSSSPNLGTRIYGMDYHGSGLPACVVEAYPQTWQDLLPVWDVLQVRFNGDALAQLSFLICDNLPETTDALVQQLTPTPGIQYRVEATRPAYVVAGVPTCLTNRFTQEALAYAELWRDISGDLTEEEAAELEVLLCEGLIGSVGNIAATPTTDPLDAAVELTSTAQALIDNPPTATLGAEDSGQSGAVMLIDAQSGIRSLGSYLPPTPTPPDMGLIQAAFERATGFNLSNPRLSKDATLIAGFNPQGYLQVYQLNQGYAAIAADATAIIDARRTGEPRRIGLQPTATATFDPIGTARPTLTATVTPTAPSLVEATYAPTEITSVCDAMSSIHTLAEASADFAPPGTLLVTMLVTDPSNPPIWRFDVDTGSLHPDETLPDCVINGNCNLSPNMQWIIQQGDDIAISRTDGSDRRVLFETYDYPIFPEQMYWLPNNVVEYIYNDYVDGRSIRLLRRYDPATNELSEPFELPEPFDIIEGLSTQIISEQPIVRSMVLARVPDDPDYRYYIYNRETETTDFFARVYSTQGGDLPSQWHPLGHFLYYFSQRTREWFVYDPETEQHSLLGDLPDGEWSPDFRYRSRWLNIDLSEWEGGRIPKLAIWDSETNATRTYCLPETGFVSINSNMLWSPDGRYIAFQAMPVPGGDDALTPTPTPQETATLTPSPTISLEEQRDLSFLRTYVLDLQTGELVEISREVSQIRLWLEDVEDTP